MTKEEIKWMKENAPWDYEALYGDPVTGNATNSGCGELILIVLIALGIGSLLFYCFGGK